MRLYCKQLLLVVLTTVTLMATLDQSALAIDPEGCLVCHGYRSLARLDDTGENVKIFYVESLFYHRREGPHAKLLCTDCHNYDQVESFPHQEITPVNCSQSCHVYTDSNLEIPFTHDYVNPMLEDSMHNLEVLDKSNKLLGEPLTTSQSRCLLCHGERAYRGANDNLADEQVSVGRCNTCHDMNHPIDTGSSYRHVLARSQPARSHRQLVQDCALCHSNTIIKEEFDLTDSITSYLASFHGKAMLLNDESTASCLDCHVGSIDNIHQIKSQMDRDSSAFADNLPATCRNSQCHSGAGEKIDSASIHLQLNTSRGIEYFIATFFVVLIILTFGPSVILIVLNLLQIVVDRHDPSDSQNRMRAQQLQQDSKGRQLLKRFTPYNRVQHWYLVITFVVLVVTGFPMKFADWASAEWFIGSIGGLGVARLIHRIAGVLLIFGFAWHMLVDGIRYIIREKKRTDKNWFRILLSFPMTMNINDFKKMGQLLLYLLFLRRTRPSWGRFSLEDKFEYFGVFWGTIILGFTGLLMWGNSLTTQYLPGRVLTISNIIHSYEAYLALLHVGIVHLAGVLLAPSVFPCSPAMFTGDTPVGELAETHPQLLDDAEKQLEQENNDKKRSSEANHE